MFVLGLEPKEKAIGIVMVSDKNLLSTEKLSDLQGSVMTEPMGGGVHPRR